MQSDHTTEIDLELYNKLLKCGIIRANTRAKINYEKKKMLLDPETQGLYENGYAFGKYLIVLKELLNIGILIDQDQKSLIVAGDQEEIHSIFNRIERFLSKIAGKQIINYDSLYRAQSSLHSAQIIQTMQTESSSTRQAIKPNQKKKVIKDGVDILTMNQDREPVDTESTLELILNTLCRAFSMKPKQAAALLTNNNQFLIHSIVKGVKGKYEPLICWYQDVYANSKHLAYMLELEQEQFPESTNFKKVLQTLSCGMYSHSIDICKWCSKLLAKIGFDFKQNFILFDQATQWFFEKEGSLELHFHAYKKHPDLAEDFVYFVSQFGNASEQIEQVYHHELKKYFNSPFEYVNAINDLFPFLLQTCQNDIKESGILDFWLESCIRQSDNDGKHNFDERIVAITLLTEIWYKPIRTVAICELFQLLDKFSEEKNPSAPAIYKTLIFSLVENPTDSMLRDIYFSNFIQLFEANQTIPVGLVIEPLIKQIQVSEGVAYFYKIFDFNFFSYVAKHPKIKIENAIPLIDLLAKIYLNDVSNASVASVPFMLVCSKFIYDDSMQEFIIKFLTIGLSMLMGLEKNGEEIQRQYQQQMTLQKEGVGKKKSKKTLALPPPPIPVSKKMETKKPTKEEKMKQMRDQEEDVIRKLKKAHIVEIAMKIQNLRNEEINDAMREMLLSTNKRFNELYGYFNKGIMALLKWWGDPDNIMESYIRSIEEREQREREEQELREQMEKDRIKKEKEEKERQEKEEREQKQLEIQEKLRLMAEEGASQEDILQEERRLLYGEDSLEGKNVRDSMGALVPYSQTKSTNQVKNVKAIQEIEKIKNTKIQREEQKRLEEERKRQISEKKKKRLRDQLEKRKIELGVGHHPSDDIKALIYKDGTNDREQLLLKKIHMPQIKLIDLDEEEERDKEAVLLFVKKYAKLWKNLFYKYANSGYNSKQVSNFDQLNEKLQTMSLAEMTKLLKDHATYPQLINKEELQQLFRLINTKVCNRNDLQALEYNGYMQFMTQLALFCYSRPPKDLSHLPPVEQIRALVLHFEKATRDRDQSVFLYEDPDATDIKTRGLVKALNEKLNQDPSYPIPEGYFKQVEKTPIYTYRVPDSVTDMVSESHIIAVEVLDEFLNGLFDFHILEPLVSFEERLKVRPMIKNQYKPQAEALNYMKKVEKKVKTEETKGTILSAHEKRNQQLDIKPNLNITLKLEVAQYPIKERQHVQEVAEVLEEILQATERGLTRLPPRFNRAPGQIYNEAKKKKNDDQAREKGIMYQREEKRVKRHNELQSEIQKNKEEKEKQIEETRKAREEQQRKEKEMQKQKMLKNKSLLEERKRQIEEQKQNNLEGIMQKKQEELNKQKEIEEKKKKVRAEFMRQQKSKLTEEFDRVVKERQDLAIQQEEVQKKKKEKEQVIRLEMENYIKEHQQDKEKEKEERNSINDFLHQSDVESVFAQYDKSLHYMYKFYASQDKKDLSFTLDKSMNSINYRELVRFGFQQNVVPVLLQPEDMVHIFRQLIRERIAEVSSGLEDNYIVDHNFQQLLDYEYFKKALVRIAIVAQDHLGGQREDLLLVKLDQERLKQEEEHRKKEKLKQKEQEKIKAEKEVREEMKQEFLQQTLAASHKSPPSKQDKKAGLTQASIQETYEINLIKKQNEEAFFDKWIKQREAQGISLKKRTIGKEKEGDKYMVKKKKKANTSNKDNEDDGTNNKNDEMNDVREGDDLAAGTSKKYTSPLTNNRKTKTLKELQALQEQAKQVDQMKGLKIEERQVRKELNVKIITSKTIEALLLFLGLKADESKQGMDNKLNQARIEIQGQKPTKFKKQMKTNSKHINFFLSVIVEFDTIKEYHEDGEQNVEITAVIDEREEGQDQDMVEQEQE